MLRDHFIPTIFFWKTDKVLSVVSYGCETWSVTLWEENRLRVSEKMLRRIFGPSGGRLEKTA
jgi:hypothetical protein